MAKKYVINKNLDHNGKAYAKGYELQPGDPGAKELIQAGHADTVEVGEAPKAEISQPKVESEVAEEAKPVRKSKR